MSKEGNGKDELGRTRAGEAAAEQRRRCFVITPIGSDGSGIRRAADGVYEAAIRPVLEQFGYEIFYPRDMPAVGSITDQILRHIQEDEMVVANLTGLNPNVMYELAVRHSFRLPVVTIAERGTVLPFDLSGDRVVFYDDDMHGVGLFRPPLEAALRAAEAETRPDNPVVRATRSMAILKDLEEDDPRRELLDRMDQLGREIGRLGGQFSSPEPHTQRVYVVHFRERLTAGEANRFLEAICDLRALRSGTLVGENRVRFAAEKVLSYQDLMEAAIVAGLDIDRVTT